MDNKQDDSQHLWWDRLGFADGQDKLGCFTYPMWMERVLFRRREQNRSYWRTVYGEQRQTEEALSADPVKVLQERDFSRILMLAGHNRFPMEQTMPEGGTPLQYAIRNKDAELVSLLLSLGAQVLDGYRPGESPLELAGFLEEEALLLLLEAITTDLALEQGMIPTEFGWGEWDYMGQEPLFYQYGSYWYENAPQKLFVKTEEKPDAIKLFLAIGIEDPEENRKRFFEALRSRLAPFGYQVWKSFLAYDEQNGTNIEITRYTIFKAEDKWLAYAHMFFYDDCIELHINTLREWDVKYGVLLQELDFECLLMTFEHMPEDRERFWEEAFRIFPETDELDLKDAVRRKQRFIESGLLELLIL